MILAALKGNKKPKIRPAKELEWGRVDFRNRRFTLPDTKSGADVTKPLTDLAYKILHEAFSAPREKPFSNITDTIIRNSWKYAKNSIGLQGGYYLSQAYTAAYDSYKIDRCWSGYAFSQRVSGA